MVQFHMNSPKNTIAVVVGSGGVKPLGVLKFYELIESHQVRPDIIIGCNGGAIASACWAAGYSLEKCHEVVQQYLEFVQKHNIFRQLDIRTLLNLMHLPGGRFDIESGILKKDKLLEFFNTIYKDLKLEDLPVRLVITATNLETGQQVVIDKGSVAQAVYASCAMYPLLPPIQIEKKWLVDGAYSSATPTLLAVNMGFDKIITLSYSEEETEHYLCFSEFMHEYIAKILRNHARAQNAVATYMHHDEILFVNFNYEKALNLDDSDVIGKINTVSTQVVDKYKQNILEMFGINEQTKLTKES